MSKSKKREDGVDEEAEAIDRSLGHYFSPARVADIANGVIPEFDIVPCAHPDQLVQAKNKMVGSLIQGVDGMKVRWTGSCWLNPPSFKALGNDVVANYRFYTQTAWFDRGVAQYDCKDLDTLMIYSPARSGVNWFNSLLRKCTAHLVFNQRINCWISQRSCEGQPMAPRLMTSPYGGSVVFLFTRDEAARLRFIEVGQKEGVVLPPAYKPPEKEKEA